MATPNPPDPQRGIYDTMYLSGNPPVPVAFAAHLLRLATSAHEVYQLPLPRQLAERINTTASTATTPARLRVDLVPDSHNRLLNETIAIKAISPIPLTTADLASVSVPAWNGHHKLIDGPRYLQEVRPEIETKDMLLVDQVALETGTGNIFAVINNTLIAAPTERSLPGVTRAAVIKTARQLGFAVVIEALNPKSLVNDADEIFVSSSIARLRSVTTIDGQRVGPGGTPVLTAIQAALNTKNRWDISLADYTTHSAQTESARARYS